MVPVSTRFEGCAESTWLLEIVTGEMKIPAKDFDPQGYTNFITKKNIANEVLTTTLAAGLKSFVAKYEEVWEEFDYLERMYMLQDHMQMSLQRRKN